MVFHSLVRATTLVVNRWAQSALSAADMPVRPPHRGPTPLRQDRPSLAVERDQYTSLMLPGHLNSLPSHCLAVIARRSNPVHGHPLESPINRCPELQLVPTPPLHSTKTPPSHWKSLEGVSFPNSGRRNPPRDPARFAPVRAPPPFNSCQQLPYASALLTRASIRSLQHPPEFSTIARAAVRRRKCRRRRGALRRPSPPPSDAEGHADTLGTLRSS